MDRLNRRQILRIGLGGMVGLTLSDQTTPHALAQSKFLGLPVEPYRYNVARMTSIGDRIQLNLDPANSPAGKYTESSLRLAVGAVPLEMVAIPGGTFKMGIPIAEQQKLISTKGQALYEQFFLHEEPQHQVTLSDFFIGRFQVTQAHYEAVMGANPAYIKFQGVNNPVDTVSWDDAQEFIRRLNQLSGKLYRLPTEAEWEYATRAGTSTPYCYGEIIDSSVVNYYPTEANEQFREATMAVNTLHPNLWGLYHVHGNVWEWCADHYYDSYKLKPEILQTNGSIPWTEVNTPSPPLDRRLRVLRGGSWFSDISGIRSAARYRNLQSLRNLTVGFRVAL
ncbi:MAG: formylglycine-generating enzyme family protein [Synechococcales bacterium]|nr:formylglycine-generating enzyme family protein [Cyanobacteria bacterium REEB444]MEB3126224.1 formylglycine-generating enzyme family protein [Synechococcales bacterium]